MNTESHNPPADRRELIAELALLLEPTPDEDRLIEVIVSGLPTERLEMLWAMLQRRIDSTYEAGKREPTLDYDQGYNDGCLATEGKARLYWAALVASIKVMREVDDGIMHTLGDEDTRRLLHDVREPGGQS